MTRVLDSVSTGAAIYVFSDDHCPPHVHARNRGEGWIARVRFSYVDATVTLISIAPLRNTPLQRIINALIADVVDGLPICRRSWWETRRTTCLENQWAAISVDGRIVLSPTSSEDARRVAKASYDSTAERLFVTFQDGTTRA